MAKVSNQPSRKPGANKPGANKAGANKANNPTVRWTTEPADKDYPAAQSYLRLIADDATDDAIITALQQAETIQQHAKDILRASNLPLLPSDNAEVMKDLAKVANGIELSPILLVRGDIKSGRPLQVADGYHRLCASYHLDEDTEIPCRLVSIPTIN
jgi:hypothetical protein